MRLLRLDLAHGRSTIDLHPFLTVASGLTVADVEELLETIRRLARGSTAGVRGLVQNQGLLVDLDGYGVDGALAVTGANVVVDCDAFAESGAAGLRARIDQTRRRAELDAVAVEEIRAELAPAAKAEVALLAAELGSDDAARLADLDDEIETLTAGLEAVSAHPPTVFESTEEILELRRRWSEHQARRAAAEEHISALTGAVRMAEERAVGAREVASQAGKMAKPVLLTRAEEARLENLSFPDQDDSRKGKWRKVLRPEEEEEKAELLARVGVDSWTAYTVYRAAPTATPDKVEAAALAERFLKESESRLETARGDLAADEVTSQLDDAEDAIRAVARQHLGHLLPADVGAALDDLVTERPNPEWLAMAGRLSDLMSGVKAPAVASASSPFEADLDPAEAHRVIAAAQRALDTRRRERADIDFDRLRAELDDAEALLARHERALPRLERAEAAVASTRRRLIELESALAAGEGQAGPVETVLAQIAPVVNQVEQEARGSLPIAVVGRFDRFGDAEAHSLMGELSRHADDIQILLVTDNAAIAAWAHDAGLDRALVSSPKAMDRPNAA